MAFDITRFFTYERLTYAAPIIFFCGLQCAVVWALLPNQETRALLFWYCNNVAFFYAIAFYSGNVDFIRGINLVGLLPQLLWVSDFLSHLVGFDLSRTADYVFVEGFTFPNDVSVLLHMTVPFIAIIYLYHIRPHPKALYYSALYIIGLYVATLSGTNPIDDMNCVFNACSQYQFAYHAYLWPLYMLVLAVGAYAVHEGLYRSLGKYRNQRLLRATP